MSSSKKFRVVFLNEDGISEKSYDTLRQAQPAAVGVRSGRSESRIATMLIKPDGTSITNFNPKLTDEAREIATERLRVASCADVCNVTQPRIPPKIPTKTKFNPTKKEMEIIENLTELCKFTVVLGGLANTYEDASGVCATEHMDYIINLSKDIASGKKMQEDAIHQFVRNVFRDINVREIYHEEPDSFTTNKTRHTPAPSRRKITDDMVVGGRKQEVVIQPPTTKTTRGKTKKQSVEEEEEYNFDAFEPVPGESLAERRRKQLEKERLMKKYLRSQPPMKLVKKYEGGVQIFFNEESRARIHNIMAHLLGINPQRYVMFGEPFNDPEYPDFTHVLQLDMSREKKFGRVGEWVVSGGRIPVSQLEAKINSSAFKQNEALLIVLYPENDYEMVENVGVPHGRY